MKLINRNFMKKTNYGKQDFIKTENLDLEIGDILFSLIYIANSLNISLSKSLISAIEKYDNRFIQKGTIDSKI